MIPLFAVTAVAALIGSAVGTSFLRSRAVKWGLVDIPNERSLHTRIMPRGGGVVIVAAVLFGLAALSLSGAVPLAPAAAFAGSALIVAAVGWLDDFWSLSPHWRLAVHLAAALLAVAIWGTFDRLVVPGSRLLLLTWPAAALLTTVWIVGLLNAYNFMDGIDGLAAAVGVAVGLLWMWAGGVDVPLVGGTGAVIAGASAGFLWHNWAPARIFMGDAGSGFLGFSFAVLPLIAFDATGDGRIPLAASLIVAPFLFDTTLTFVRRLVNGENVLRAHRSHLYQRLVLSGWSHRRVACLYVGLGGACGAAGVAWTRGASPVLLAPAVVALLLLPAMVTRAERNRSKAELQSGAIRVK